MGPLHCALPLRIAGRAALPAGPLTPAGILANSGPRSRLRTIGRVASKHRFATPPEPSAKPLRVRVRIQSRERSSAKRCGSERFLRSAQWIALLRKAGSAMQSRSNHSLWPEFWRIPAPVRGSEPTATSRRNTASPRFRNQPQKRCCERGMSPFATAREKPVTPSSDPDAPTDSGRAGPAGGWPRRRREPGPQPRPSAACG